MDPGAALAAGGVGRGDLVAVVEFGGEHGRRWVLATAHASRPAVRGTPGESPGPPVLDAAGVEAVERALTPRWVTWSQATTRSLVDVGIRPARTWDLAAVHRLLFGGWRADPGRIWARLNGLPLATLPVEHPVDLFHPAEPDDEAGTDPLGEDGHVRAAWASGGWGASVERAGAWAALAVRAAALQQGWIDAAPERARVSATARSESAAETLCAELAVDGLPFDLTSALAMVEEAAGPRPASDADADAIRARRDDAVLRHLPDGYRADLRSPGQVKSLLRRVGIEVPDTRAWRLQQLRDAHPVVEALLAWRKAERIATTYGYAWLDANVGPGPVEGSARLRGEWTGSDGAAGRMTATAGLHNMPAELRPAVVADPGHVFVRADLGQIEPRVLAAVSGDAALARACLEDDLYVPVAGALGVERAVAKVAVLGAMYGQTTGRGAQALRSLQANYPVAMGYLEEADRTAQVGRDLRTYGGRRIRMGVGNANEVGERELRTHAAARGRYGRNAVVQGAAAELFKQWAVTVRARGTAMGAVVVLCLHDELLVHVPGDRAADTAALVEECLREVAHRWAPAAAPGVPAVRFTVDLSVVDCWADAKEG